MELPPDIRLFAPRKGLCRVLELMLVGDSNGRPVAVPVLLIIALVERVQRMASSVVKGHGPQVGKHMFSERDGHRRDSGKKCFVVFLRLPIARSLSRTNWYFGVGRVLYFLSRVLSSPPRSSS